MGTTLDCDIVKWVQYDNKMKEYNDKIKVLRQERDALSGNILEQMDIPKHTPNKQLPQFEIEALNTKVACHRQKHYDSLNYKFLNECLCEYFQNTQTLQQSQEMAKDIMSYIRQKRGYEEKVILKRDSLH